MVNMVERLREVKLSPEEEQKREICVRHEEEVLLFCKDDGKNQIVSETQHVQAKFNQMRGNLDYEEQKEQLKLRKEEANILYKLTDAENVLVQQSQLVRALISDVEHSLQGSTTEMPRKTWEEVSVTEI
ncbi:hypothetical protein HPG69_005760 [Diceros bicornis minor]|uniref:Uncharacterized protein n=1 Tax=Diceros bicornis minor TaxID=77932 RepID=A0A7J7ET07_DICBM|nr:hypothetical protein HPG69_005760 [Diceros bicornis minor]